MEVFGILLSIPAAICASALYRHLLLKAHTRWGWLKHFLLWSSWLVLAAIVAESALLGTRGAVGARVMIGRGFYGFHLLIFFLGTPSLMNVLVLPAAGKRNSSGCLPVCLCVLLAFVLVLMQFGVSESLYGIDGHAGPFSSTVDSESSAVLRLCAVSL
jgi:hypothetical protein